MRFCTCVTPARLPYARVLADGLARHHPHATLLALTLGGDPGRLAQTPFQLVTIDDLDLDLDLGGGVGVGTQLHAMYTLEDLALTLRPALLAHARAAGDDVCFLTDDHDILGAIEPVAGVGLVRRVDGELPDDTFAPDAHDLAAHGMFSPDLVIVGTGTQGDAFLEWWNARMSALRPRLANGEPATGRVSARRHARSLLTLAPSLFAFEPLADRGLEVSAWNLHARALTRAAGGVLADGCALRSVQFSDFDPQRPYWLSAAADRVRVVEDPVLGALCGDYAQRLLAHGADEVDRRRDIGRRLPNGLVFDARLLNLYHESLGDIVLPGDLFDAGGCAAFMSWMQGPAPAGAAAGINRYLYRVYRDRHDLPIAFPDLDGADGAVFAGWAWSYGRREMAIGDEFLPPHPTAAPPDVAPPPLGVNVAGFFTGTLGLGEAARLYVRALDAAHVPVTTTTVEFDQPVDDAERRLGKDYGRLAFADVRAAERCPFNLICVNADELPRFVAESGGDFFGDRCSIGVWAWETDVIPARWDGAYEHLDEIWVYSRYVAEHLGRASPVPVVIVPPPVVAPDGGGASSAIELPAGYRFMFMFDFFSTQRRKNATGVVEAFRRAFAPGEGPQLLIKTIHGAARPRAYDELRHAAAGRPDVHVVDRALSVAAKNALMTECDCYVSLHRSEGYGLTLAESMALGKPVIGTGFSGNTDFMSPQNSYLVDYAMTDVGGDVEIYPPEGHWAEPDLDHAAQLMREVYEDQPAALARGERARVDIATTLSPEVVGRIARNRLERLVALRAR